MCDGREVASFYVLYTDIIALKLCTCVRSLDFVWVERLCLPLDAQVVSHIPDGAEFIHIDLYE